MVVNQKHVRHSAFVEINSFRAPLNLEQTRYILEALPKLTPNVEKQQKAELVSQN